MSTNYDIHADDGIQALIAEAEADPDVIGLVLIGSRAIDAITLRASIFPGLSAWTGWL